MDNLLIIGAGQYGAMLKESARALNVYDKIDFLDDRSEEAIGKICDYTKFTDKYQCAIVAIGDGWKRVEISDKLKAAGYRIVSFISRRAYVSQSAKIAEGCVIEPMAVISTSVEIGRCVIVSSGAVVNHNSSVGDGCHINCNATVRSNSEVPPMIKVDYGEIF
jgi:acetyltransferase-like isoleucine patch superfamily enzyme